MSWAPVTPAPSVAFSAVTATSGVQFWKAKAVDAGDGSAQFCYVLDEEAPIALRETIFLTLSDTLDVLP